MSKTTTKPWVIYRCWAGQVSTLVPHPTDHSFWTRGAAGRFAADLTRAMSTTGTWFEVRRRGGESSLPPVERQGVEW